MSDPRHRASRSLLLLAVATLCACPGEPPPDDDDDATTPELPGFPYASSLVGHHPADGAAAVFAHDGIYVDFDVAPRGFTLDLADDAGASVPAAGRWITADRFLLQPESVLASEQSYTATVTWVDEEERREVRWAFSTSDRAEVPAPPGVVGGTWRLDLTSGRVLSPKGGAAVLTSAALVLLHRPTGLAPYTSVDAFSALGAAPPTQDLCAPSVDFGAAGPPTYSDPWFSAGPVDRVQALLMPWVGATEVRLQGFSFAGMYTTRSGDGPADAISHATFSALIDVRDVGLGEACDLFDVVFPNIDCVPCPGEPDVVQCLDFVVTDIVGVRDDSIAVQAWTEDDAAGAPDCE